MSSSSNRPFLSLSFCSQPFELQDLVGGVFIPAGSSHSTAQHKQPNRALVPLSIPGSHSRICQRHSQLQGGTSAAGIEQRSLLPSLARLCLFSGSVGGQ